MLLLVVFELLPLTLYGQLPNKRDVEALRTLKYRRIYVPSTIDDDEFGMLVRGYLPMQRDEFERLIHRLDVSTDGPLAKARIQQAEYVARLDQGNLLVGSAKLTVLNTSGEVAAVRLEPFRLAIGAVEENDEAGGSTSIVSSFDGSHQLLAEKSGVYEITWSLLGKVDSYGHQQFEFSIPPSSSNSLLLSIPRALTPIVDQGIVEMLESPEAIGGGLPNERTWRIDLGGRTTARITMLDESSVDEQSPLTLVREVSSYVVSSSQVALTVDFHLDMLDKPLKQLELTLDGDLELVPSRFGDQRIVARRLDDSAQGMSRFVLELPEPMLGTDRVVHLAALATLSRGTETLLPRIRMQNAVWQEGRSTLSVARPLSLLDISTTACRVTSISSLPEPARGESIQLQHFSPNSRVEIIIDTVPTRLRSRSGTSVVVSPSGMTAKIAARITAIEGEQFRLQANIARPWIVDSVSAAATDSSGTDSNIVLDWDTIPTDAKTQRLQVQLRRAIRAGREVDLTVQAHRPPPTASGALSGEQLIVGSLLGIDDQRQFIEVRTDPSLEMGFEDDSRLNELRADELSSLQRSLLTVEPTSQVFVVDSATKQLITQIRQSTPSYSSENEVRVVVAAQRIGHLYRVRVTPQSSRVQRMLVHLSQPSVEPIAWSVEGEGDRAIVVRRLPDEEREREEIGGEGEIWEIQLRRPRDVPFTIIGRSSAELTPKQMISFVWLPHAASQVGTVSISSVDGTQLSIGRNQLVPIPTAPQTQSTYTTTRAEYRYEPGEFEELFVSPCDDTEAKKAAWVWQSIVHSYFGTRGSVHVADFYIENAGQPDVEIEIPKTATLKEVSINGELTKHETTESAQKKLRLNLPDGQRFPLVRITYADDQNLPTMSSAMFAPIPSINLAILEQRQFGWLPSEYERRNDIGLSDDLGKDELTWNRRLFGPFERESNRLPAFGELWSWIFDAKGSSSGVKDGRAAQIKLPSVVQPWHLNTSTSQMQFASSDWTVYELDDSLDGSQPIFVYRPRSFQTFGWVTFLLVASIVWWTVGNAPIRIIPIMTIFGVIALLISDVYIPIATGLFWGGAVGAILSIVWPRGLRGNTWNHHPQPQQSVVPAVATTTVLIFAMITALAVSNQTFGQSASEASLDSSNSDKTNPVVIRIDKDGQPTGDLVYLPEKFKDTINDRIEALSMRAKGWFIHSSVYRATIETDLETGRLGISDIVATFDLDVLRDNTRVTLPFNHEQIHLISEPAKLDGQPVSLKLEAEKPGVTILIEESGRHRLELGFHPSTDSANSKASVRFSIPGVVRSQLELRVPSAISEIEIPTSLGRIERIDSDRVVADLGPADELQVRWPMALDNLARIRTDEVLWLRVRPGSVLIDARFKFSIPTGSQLDEIRFEFDPNLQLRAVPNDKTSAPETWLEGGRQIAQISLNEPITAPQFMYEAAFVLTDATGVGHLRLPRIAVQAEQRGTPVLAVSVDQSLQYEVLNSSNEEPTGIGDFLSKWEDNEIDTPPPQMAFKQPGQESTWELATRPIETQSTGTQETKIIFGNESATVSYSCNITTSSGSVLIHRLSVPAELSIESVTFTEGDRKHPVRWTRSNRSQVSLMLHSRALGSQRIQLTGSIPTKRGRVAWSGIRCTSAKIGSTQLDIYRTNDVGVEIVRADGFAKNEDVPAGFYQAESGRQVASLVSESNASVQRVTLQIKPNRPRLECTQLTQMHRRDGEWMAEITAYLIVRDGNVDELRFEVPNSLDNPQEIEPSSDFAIEQIPSRNRRQLIFRMATPVTGEYKLRFQCRVNSQPVSSPDIELLDVAQLERFLLLPTRIADRQVRWDTSGLVEATLPENMSGGSDADSAEESMLVARPNFHAAIQDVRHVSGTAKVRLEDVRVAFCQDGSYEGVAVFDLQPAGERECVLKLPAGCSLVHTWIAGLPAIFDPLGDNRWNLRLGPGQLSQRIAVVYKFQTSGGDLATESWQLTAPILDGIPVQQTVWTIRAPSPNVSLQSPNELKVIDPITLETHRYKAVADLIDAAQESAKERSAVETQNWYTPWARRLAISQIKLEQAKSGEINFEAEGIDFESLKKQQAEIAARLKTTKILTQMTSAGRSDFTEPQDVWSLNRNNQTAIYAMSDGAASTVKLTGYATRTSSWLLRVWQAIVLVLICLASYLMVRRSLVSDLLLEWPFAVGVLLGIAWIVWLTPSFIGLVIIAASVVRSLRPNWVFVSEQS